MAAYFSLILVLVTLGSGLIWMVDALTQYPGHVKSKDQLMKAAQTHVDDNTITTYIKRIRDHFKTVDSDFDRIETVYSRGYRWKS